METNNLKYSKKWIPYNEMGEITFRDFNKRFPIDQHFRYDTLLNRYSIRFVKHPNLPENHVKVFIVQIPSKYLFWKWDRGQLLSKFSSSAMIFEDVLTIEDCKKIYNITL